MFCECASLHWIAALRAKACCRQNTRKSTPAATFTNMHLCFIHEQHGVVDEAEQGSEINEKFAADACPGWGEGRVRTASLRAHSVLTRSSNETDEDRSYIRKQISKFLLTVGRQLGLSELGHAFMWRLKRHASIRASTRRDVRICKVVMKPSYIKPHVLWGYIFSMFYSRNREKKRSNRGWRCHTRFNMS